MDGLLQVVRIARWFHLIVLDEIMGTYGSAIIIAGS